MESKKERYPAIDGLRTFACIGIVLMHVKANVDAKPTFFFVDNIIGYAGDFVLLFMMISAFSLCCGYYEKFNNNSLNISVFYKKRYLRILPFFSLLCLFDVLKTVVSEHFVFNEVLKSELYEAYANLTLLFGFIPGNDISVVGVGWFLGVIFIFYVFYPFFCFLIRSNKTSIISFLVVIGLYISIHNYFGPVKGVSISNNSFICCLPFFLVGGLIYRYRFEIIDLLKVRVLSISMSLIAFVYTLLFFLYPDYRFLGANLILYALWLIYAISHNTRFLNNKVVLWLSRISMEIYLCHMMFFRVIEKLHLENSIKNNNVCYIVTCASVFIFAVLFSFFWKRYLEPKVLSFFE